MAEQKAANRHIGGGVPKTDYVQIREERGAALGLPDRMLAALQVNLRGGTLPDLRVMVTATSKPPSTNSEAFDASIHPPQA